MRRLPQGYGPQPLLQAPVVIVRVCQQPTPVVQCRVAKRTNNSISYRPLDILPSLHDKPLEQSIMDDQDVMLVEPAFQFVQQVAALGPTCQAFLEPTHDVPALVSAIGRKPSA